LRIVSGADFLAEPVQAPWNFSDLERLHTAVGVKCARQEELGGVQCRKGCFHCCRRIPTLLPVEYAFLSESLLGMVGLGQAGLESELHPGEPLCGLLAGDGSCGIYGWRPLICRTHGFLHITEQGLDHCPWNFADLEEVDGDLPFQLEDLHETLLRVNVHFLRRSYPSVWTDLAQARIRFQ
jgi:Fe-S-cluster containining protein